ncbi:hypothetical protein AXK56_17265 [Tsukamurella pulmonis]|uniref:Uncharacterized protein n=1 Tax=Tsukamurella pulmonis TaxID=47312 RepID=A0A1H1HSI7_9ACTN|nr:hypothetical protein [Tsukamurella pulmonis]KXO94408.1 hypothetical protein AXK56_17265 [Tsukamurella pulmonis]SDR28475.1 hypothetical protein SAMN04489765_4550 [Tsukamurella pulmonis]SUP13330.1 Uncharacterised protein [Tsukamurella pulmonis]
MIAVRRDLVAISWVLPLLVLVNSVFLLRGTMLGVDEFDTTWPWMSGVILFGLWVSYLVVWFRRTRTFSWRLLSIPLIGVLALALAFTDTPRRIQWIYDEPRLTAAARQVLADPRIEFSDDGDRRVGTLRVLRTAKAGGAVRFAIPPTDTTTGASHLEYRPDGSEPSTGSGSVARRLSAQWWRVIGF